MKDYIQFPSLIKSTEDLNDGLLKSFLEKCERIDDTKFSLNDFRGLYVKNKNEFVQIIDELTLRGFLFYIEKPNNIIPSGQVQLDAYIITTIDRQNFKKINFQKLGMSGFVKRFNVESDMFFNKIPLEGFKKINSNIEKGLLENELNRAGFNIFHQSSGKVMEIHKPYKPSYENNICTTRIIDGFYENMFRHFRIFCKKNKIINISDLLDKHFDEFHKYPGVGVGKVEAAQKRLNYLLNQHSSKKISEISTDSSHLTVESVFSDYGLNSFLTFCNNNGIKLIKDIEEKHIEIYGNLKGIGIGKVNAVKARLEECLFLDISQSEKLQTSKIDDLFSGTEYLLFLKYCHLKKLETIHDLKDNHLQEFANMRGVGSTKVVMVKKRLKQLLKDSDKLINENKTFNFISTAQELKINAIFTENKFNLFKEFCMKKNLSTLGQISQLGIEEFAKFKMVGKKKIQEVLDIISLYVQTEFDEVVLFNSGEIFELLKDVELKVLLQYYGFNVEVDDSRRLKDIEGIEIKEIKGVINPQILFDLASRLNKQQNPKEIASNIKNLLDEREYGVLKHRYVLDQTLEEVGIHFGVTRERIRQVQKKIVKKLTAYLRRKNFFIIIKIIFNKDEYITKQRFIELLGQENEFLINFVIKENISIIYYEKLDVFFINTETKRNIKFIETFINELPEVFNLYEYQQLFEEIFEKIGIVNPSIHLIEKLIEANKYKKHGEIYSRHRLRNNEIYSYIFKHYVPEALRLNEEGYEQLKILAKKHLDSEIGQNLRSVDARLRETEDVILVDRLTFQYFNSENFDTTFINKVEQYLIKMFQKKDVINVEEIYVEFQSELPRLNIKNKLHLYSIIRYYLDDKFNIGYGNTLNFFKNETLKVNIEERLVSFIKSKGGMCSKDHLLEVLKPLYKLDLAISSSDKILPWGLNHAILIDKLKLTNEIKKNLRVYLNECFKEGFSTASFIFNEMIFDKKMSTILKEKGIDEPNKLPAIIKFLMPNVKGHTNFLYIEGKGFNTFEDVIILKFSGETTRNEIKEFAKKYGYKDMMASAFLKRLLEDEVFIEVDVDILYPDNLLEISQFDLSNIKKFVDETIYDNKYLSLSNLKGYRRKLPSIQFRWNPHLLNSVLQRCGYRQIKKIYNDYRFDKVIVVKNESPIKSFEDLIYFVVKNEYSGNMHEVNIYDFLAEKGILREHLHAHKKVLPYEIRSSEKFIFDELGYVTLR